MTLTWIFATALSFSLFDPVFGFGIYISLIIFRPWELWPSDTIFLLIPRLGALWTIGYATLLFIKERKNLIVKSSYIIILFFTWALLSSVKSPLVGSALSNNLQTLIPSLSLFFLVQFWIVDRNDYDFLTDAFTASVLVSALLAIILYAGNSNDPGRIEAMGILSNSNDIAALCILALPFTLKPFFSPQRYPSKQFYPLYFFMPMPLLLIIYYSQSRGALLALATVVGGWIFTHFRVRWYILILFLLVTFLSVNYIASRRDVDDVHQSTQSRISYWIAGGNMALHNPILGVGMGNYPDKFEQYSSSHLYEFGKRTAHSSWILILAETGIVGFLFFISIFILALKEAYKRIDEYPEVFLSLAGYMMTMSFLSHSYLFYPYLILGIVFAITRLLPLKEKNK